MTDILTTKEAAVYLQLSCSFLKKGRFQGTGPKFLKCGRAIRYRLIDLDLWLNDRICQNTLQAKGEKHA